MLILGLVVAWRVIRRRAAMLPMDPSPADASQTDDNR
jgi:hypothetical protein